MFEISNVFRVLTVSALCGILWACSASEGPRTFDDIEALPTLSLRVTSDIDTPETMIKAGFIPKAVKTEGSNFVLNLPGQIVALADTGSLWYSSTEGESFALISVGAFTDFHSSAQKNGQSLILAVKEDGIISAFSQTGDDNFSSLPVSITSLPLKGFCSGGEDVESHLIARNGDVHSYSVTVSSDNAAEVNVGQAIKSDAKTLSCRSEADGKVVTSSRNKNFFVWNRLSNGSVEAIPELINTSNAIQVSEDVYIGLDSTTHAILLTKKTDTHKLIIEDGLSIRGIEKSGFIAYSSAPMGTVFGDGVILLSDHEDNRIVLISLDYANRELAKMP